MSLLQNVASNTNNNNNPISTFFSGESSFYNQFLTSSLFIGNSIDNNNSTNHWFNFNYWNNNSNSFDNGMLWNATMTNVYMQKGLESILLYCFPSFIIESTLFQFFFSFLFYLITSNNIFTAGIALIVAGKVWEKISNQFNQFYYFIVNFFVYTLEIKERENYRFNTIYVCMVHWLATVEHFQNARHLTVHANCDLTNNYQYNKDESEQDLILQLIPGPGSHGFTFKGHKITIHRIDPSSDRNNNDNNKKDDGQKLVLSVSAWNGKSILKQVVEEAIKCHFQSEKGVTSVYTLSNEYRKDWEKLCDRPYRSLDSIYLEEELKDKLIKDLDRFMNNEEFYRENCLNYQRGYLCHGPPGTGKSSLILAVAAKLNCCLFSVSLSDKSLDDTKLQKMLTKLPKRGIILLEDIDAAFNEKRKASDDVQGVTFSGLLNALDGVASHSQFPRIIFMTTNHIENLDSALIRPGRIDFKIKFDYSTKDQIRQMASRFFKNEELGKKMSELIPEKKLTTAELQTYLMRYIYDPEDSVNYVNEYLEEVDNLKKEMDKKNKEEEAVEIEEQTVESK
ncbi:hypothetical protein ABK040_015039 [Willaertia magna]